jgi:putative DNA primase/helicase
MTVNKASLVCGECGLLRTPACHYAEMIPQRIATDTDASCCPKFRPNQPSGAESPPVSLTYFDGNGRFIPKRLGDEFLQRYNFKTMNDNREIYIYQDGVYLPNGESIIREEVRAKLADKTTSHLVTEVLEHVKDLTNTQRQAFNLNVDLICLENGVYDLETGQLQPHSPNVLFLQKHPIDFDPNAQCPKIEEFLKQILSRTEDQETIYQLIGYCLYRSHKIQKAFMLVGSGANGKSTLLNLIKRFLGQNNITSTSLQELESNRFALARLLGKNANVYPDLPAQALFTTSRFKGTTGGDPLTAEHKFGKDFNFENYAKFIFSANAIPRSDDESDAFFRRWIIVTFPNKFEGQNCNLDLLEQLSTPEELGGLLNKALEGLKTLLAEGKFKSGKQVEDVREEYIRKSDPIQAFVWDRLEIDPDTHVSKIELYASFQGYCKDLGYIAPDVCVFNKRLPFLVPARSYQAREDDGSRPRCWKGIKLILEQVERMEHPFSNYISVTDTGQDNNKKNPVPTVPTCSKTYPPVSGHIVSEPVPQLFHYGPGRKAVCGTCYKSKYELLERVGVLAEGLCRDCGSPASLLIQLDKKGTSI